MSEDKPKTENGGELLPSVVKMARPEKEYMNISKVAHYISANTGLVDNETSLRLKTIPKKNVFVDVDLHKDEHLQLSSPNVTQYDMAVLDAVYTLFVNKQSMFSPEMLLRIMSGNFEQDASPQKIGSITRSINKLRHIDIRIDYTDEARARKLIGMFIAIIIPPARENRSVLIAILLAIGASYAFAYVPALSAMSGGWSVIIITVGVSALMAWLFPIAEDTSSDGGYHMEKAEQEVQS